MKILHIQLCYFFQDIKESVHIFTLSELLNIYEEADQFLSESPNIKLQLIMNDERFITYYLFGQCEEMVKLAEATIEDCRGLNHLKGEEFRLFLFDRALLYTRKQL